jgi:hypothetical protein
MNGLIRDHVMRDVLCNLGDWAAECVGSGASGEVVGRCSGWVWEHIDAHVMSRVYEAVYRDI